MHLPASHILGVKGEQIAVDFLRKQGFEIRGTNVRFGRDELDIIAFDPTEKMMVFFEVKTRSTNNERYPIRLAVDRRKRRCLQRAIHAWCIEQNYDGPGRIDILCVSKGRIADHIKELESVFG